MGVCALATWKGRDEERLAAGGLLAGWALTRVTYSDPSHTQWGVLAVDISLLWLLGWIALRSRRYWPLFAVGFHLLAVFTHLARSLDSSLGGWAYVTAEIIWGYLLAFVIGYAAWTTPGLQVANTPEVDSAPPGDTRR